MKSFNEARCSKPCDSGDGPGTKTYKIKYVKASQGEFGNMGSCELDEEGKVEGQEYDVTIECNKDKCPDCEVKSKGPFKDELVDYTGSITINGNNKTFTKCLLPKQDGTFEDIDCGGAKGGFNYNKGARSKYNVTYNITEDSYGVQNCTKGEDVIEEGCSVNAFTPGLNPIVGGDGKLVKGGGEECGNECILSDNYPQLVMVEGKECSKTCGGGLKRMRKVVQSKSDAPYCPCKNDPSKCPYEEVPCNTQDCIADCVYTDGENTQHVQINDYCPGVEGPNKHVVWDTEKTNSAGGKGMWYDNKKNKYYERNHFVKKMRVPTKEPIIGKGKCHQGDKADKTLPCPIAGIEKPIDAEWGPWKFESHMGTGYTLGVIGEEYSSWNHPDNPNFGKKGEHCVIEDGLEETDTILPGKRYVRELKKLSDGQPGPRYGGKPASQVDGGNHWKIEPYMKKDDGTYTKYCPVAAQLTPEIDIDTIDITGSLSNQERCYLENDKEGRGKYTIKELEDESKRSFERDNELPEYTSPREDVKKTRIVSPGNRTIYRSKSREVNTLQKHGGFPSGSWHKTSEGYTKNHLADERLHEYDECVGVGKVLEKIRKNNPSWKSSNIVKQVDCVPIYEWDGKFYKDKESAEAGNTGEEIVTHSDTGKKELSEEEKKKNPGRSARKTNKGNFMTTFMHDHCQKPGLDSDTGWCGNRNTNDYIQMTTESEKIELVKGVVTQGRYGTSNQWVTKFEVYVSRNGDSWKQVKNASGSTTFTGNSADTKDKKVKNYFNEVVEAKYIRIVTKEWNNYNSMRIGYIRDKSGAVQCSGKSGLLQDQPWFRFVFNEAKTRDPKLGGKYSEGIAASTKRCPANGSVMIKQKGKISSGPNGISVENLKLLRDGSVKSLSDEMAKQTILGCGADPTSQGWFSSDSFASPKKWSACVQPTNTGLESTVDAWNKDDGGFRYMYREWQGSNNNGYNLVSNSDYKDNAQSSNASNGSTYNVIPTSFTINDYESVNIIRQPCNRGTKGVVPKVGTPWKSTTPYSSGQKTGHMGELWNLEGGVEGWIDSGIKYTWANGFNNKIKQLTASGNILHDYKVEEREGTNDNDDRTSWSSGWRGSNSKIGGTHGWHSPHNRDYWNTSVTNDYWTARYKDMGRFIPVGIRIQPRNNGWPTWHDYSPTQIKFRFYVRVHNGKVNQGWHWGETVTLGPFNSSSDVKTILIKPEDRLKFKECDHFYIYTRHGRGSQHTGFRINFLVGTPGVSVEDPSSSVSASDPVDCSVAWDGNKADSAGGWSRWSGWSNCSNSCGGWGTQTRSKTRKMTKYRKRRVNSPSNGGRNNCTAPTQYYPNENWTETQTQNSNCSGYCPGWDCEHCDEHAKCGGDYECRLCIFGAHAGKQRWMDGGC